MECRARVAVEVVGRGCLFMGWEMGLMETWECVLFGREEVVQPAMPCSSRSSSGQKELERQR